MNDLSKEVESMVKKAEHQTNALYALQFSQAALNAANALRVLVDFEQAKKLSEG